MVFIALKPCRFGGTDYKIGESIPAEKVLPEKVEALRAMGIITVGVDELVQQINDSVEAAMGKEETSDTTEETPKKKGK